MVLPIALSLNPDGQFFDRFHSVTLPLQAIFCLIVCVSIGQNHAVRLGQNDRGILLALAILLAFQSVSYAYQVFEVGNRSISYFFVRYTQVITFIILAWHLWDYHPSRSLEKAELNRVAGLDTKFHQVMRSLLLRR